MARIEASTHIEAPPEQVWAVLAYFEAQPEWMVDAVSVTVTGANREGVGVVVDCRTNVAGVVISDRMEVTEWSPPRVMAVRHLGRVIRGVGAFELEPTAAGTRFVWWEEVEAPFGGLGDAVAQVVVAPWVRRLFRRSLANLKRVTEEGG